MAVDVEVIYSEFGSALRRFIQGKVADPASAEDLLQDVFLRIHKQAGTLRETERIQGWVYRIARNAVIDHYRRGRETVELADELAVFETDTDGDEAARRLASSLKQMVACLPEKDRDALVLTEFEGLTQQQLAQQWGLSLSGAKSRVQRAREKLKAALLDCCHVELDRQGRVMDYSPRCTACAGGLTGARSTSPSQTGGRGCAPDNCG